MPCICFPLSYVQCHLWSYAMSAEWRLKHFINVSRYNWIPVLKNNIRNTIFCSVASWRLVYFSKVRWIDKDFTGKFGQKRIHLFWTFWSLSFKFLFKTGSHKENSKSKCGWISALLDSLLWAGNRHLLWQCINFSLTFIFFRSFEAIASPLNLGSSWQPRYSTVSSCSWLSMSHWNSDENSLSKTFSTLLMFSWW